MSGGEGRITVQILRLALTRTPASLRVLRGSQNAYTGRARTSRLPTLPRWGRAAKGLAAVTGRSPHKGSPARTTNPAGYGPTPSGRRGA